MRLGESITFYLPEGQHRLDVIDALKCITSLFSQGLAKNAEVDKKAAFTGKSCVCFQTYLHMKHSQ